MFFISLKPLLADKEQVNDRHGRWCDNASPVVGKSLGCLHSKSIMVDQKINLHLLIYMQRTRTRRIPAWFCQCNAGRWHEALSENWKVPSRVLTPSPSNHSWDDDITPSLSFHHLLREAIICDFSSGRLWGSRCICILHLHQWLNKGCHLQKRQTRKLKSSHCMLYASWPSWGCIATCPSLDPGSYHGPKDLQPNHCCHWVVRYQHLPIVLTVLRWEQKVMIVLSWSEWGQEYSMKWFMC